LLSNLSNDPLKINSSNAAVIDGKWNYDFVETSATNTMKVVTSYTDSVTIGLLEAGVLSYQLDAATLDIISKSHMNAYNSSQITKSESNFKGTFHSNGGSKVNLCYGLNTGTLSGADLKLSSILTYDFTIKFDTELEKAVQSQRAEFYIKKIKVPITIGGTGINLNNGYTTAATNQYGESQITSLSGTISVDSNDRDSSFSITGNVMPSMTYQHNPHLYEPNYNDYFVPNTSGINIKIEYTLADPIQNHWNAGSYFYVASAPEIEIGLRYKTSTIVFKTEDSTMGKISSYSYDSLLETGNTLEYGVSIKSELSNAPLTAKAIPEKGYCFLYWKAPKGVNEGVNIYDIEAKPIKLYEHQYTDEVSGKITYEAVFEKMKFTDISYQNYVYNGVGQGPRAYIDCIFTSIQHTVKHNYGNGDYSTSITGSDNDNTFNSNITRPVNVGSYTYTVSFYRTIGGNSVLIGSLETISYTISKYTPAGSVSENAVTINTYYYGQTFSKSYLSSPKNASNESYLNDTFILENYNQIKGSITGEFLFSDNDLNNGKRLESPYYGAQIVFKPTDTTNINQIILSSHVNILITKTTLKLGYLNGTTLTEGLENLSLNAINYGQLREDLGISDKVVLFNPYTYNDSNAMASVYFGYVPYDISSWGVIEERPAATDSLTEATLTFTLNQNISGTATPFSTYYELPTETIKVKYLVNKAKLVFIGQEKQQLNFTYTYYTSSTSSITTVSYNIILMYSQGLKAISIAPISPIQSNVIDYIDHGTIRFTWYRQISGLNIDNNNLLDDYYEQKFLTVAESTNANNTQNPNYYCLKAEWLIPDGSAVNSNYESYYFYNQSITISKAELNASVKFEQSTEINSDAPVIKPITYGESVDKALSVNLNKGKTLNVANQDLEVYYKIEWITDLEKNTNGISSLNNYPYALVENSGQYPVKISIFKADGETIDADNYAQDGVFSRNTTGNAFAFASLVVNRASQNFYLMVDGSLVELNNNNLTTVMTNLNEYVYKESTEGLSINYDAVGGKTDTNIELETVYIETNNTFKVVLYTTAVIYRQGETLQISEKAGATLLGFNPSTYQVATVTAINYSLENVKGTYYTKIEYEIRLGTKAVDPGVIYVKLGQYDSGHELNNPSGGNYNSKEWDPDDPFTIFVKIYKGASGIASAQYINPDDGADTTLYSYKPTYGTVLEIVPNVAATGNLTYAGTDGLISITLDTDVEFEKYLVTAYSTGAFKLRFTAPGHVNLNNHLDDPYMPLDITFWIYVQAKSAIVDLIITGQTDITYGTGSPSITFNTSNYFEGSDFDSIKQLILLKYLDSSGDYISGTILDVGNYTIQALIDNVSTSVGSLTGDPLEAARLIAKRYKIVFNSAEFIVKRKQVTITFNDSTQYSTQENVKLFTIDYYDANVIDANSYQYKYEYLGLIDKDGSITDLISNPEQRPYFIATLTTDNINFTPISARPNAGEYPLRIVIPIDCPATNYEFILEPAKLVVRQVDVDLDFTKVNQNYTTSAFNFSSNIKVTGIYGASVPTGTASIVYIKSGTIDHLTNVQHAGTYSVIVTYTSGNIDNYQKTIRSFDNVITINRIDPSITLNPLNTTYSGYTINYSPIVQGTGADYTLKGTTEVLYSQSSNDEFTKTNPLNSGTYYVRVIYTNVADDDYNSLTVTSETAIINISKADLIITSNTLSNKLNKNYDGKYIVLNDIVVSGVGADGTFDLNYLDITYQKTGTSVWTEWATNDTPINADKYDVELKYNADSNESTKANYNVTIQSYRNGAIEILKSSIETIALRSTASYVKTYNAQRKGIDIDSSTIDINIGIEGSNVPLTDVSYSNISITYAKVTLNQSTYSIGSYSSLAPVDAGDYVVRLRYNSNGSGNYADGEYYISEILTEEDFFQNVKITILKATPKITYSSIKLPYNSKAQAFTRYSISGVIPSDKPVGGFEVSYKIADSNEEWSSSAPVQINKYDIKVVFKAASTGNYTDAEEKIPSIFEITNGNVTVTLYFREEDYQGVQVNAANPTILKPDGTAVEEQYITIEYRLRNDENPANWNTKPPTDSGWYDIQIIVEASDTYMAYSNIFINILRIKNPIPKFTVENYSRIYNGQEGAFPLSYIILTNVSKSVSEINNMNGDLTGNLSIRYTLDGNNWTTESPKNVGVYSIKLIYSEGIDDHYASSESSVFNARYTITPLTVVIVPDTSKSKIYDGQPVSGDLITFTFRDSEPYEQGIQTGSLTVTSSSKNVGAYQIGKGTIGFGSNYDVRIDTAPVYFTITRRDITPIFEEVTYVYDGMKKDPMVYISVNDLVGADTVSDVILIKTVGNTNVNSGTFNVTVSISTTCNYKLPDDFNPVKTYTINKAQMTQNSFSKTPGSDVKEIVIDYDGEKHEVVLQSKEAGADVLYNLVTFVGDDVVRELAGSYVEIGEYLIEAIVSKNNYEKQTLITTLRIVKGTLSVNIIPPTETLYYGNPLPQITTSAQGIVVLNSDQTLMPGTALYNWTFTPNDEDHYLVLNGRIELTVEKAEPIIKIDGSLDQIEGSVESVNVTVYVDSQKYTVPVRVYYRDAQGMRYDSTPTAPGTYSMVIEVDGDEYVEVQTIEKEFIVKSKAVVWPYIAGGIAIGLFLLALVVIGLTRRASVR
jgi:hypothetical protein